MTAHNRPNCRWLTATLIAGVAALLAVSGRVQAAPDVAVTVARLHAYLDTYEPTLSAFIADESFQQQTTYVTEYGIRHVGARRRLLSDVGFLRLPGGLAWLGQRSVRTMDDRPVPSAARLDRAFSEAGADLLTRARAIAEANASLNLGHPRSLNLPSLPLDLLGRRRAAAFTVTLDGRATVNGRPTARLWFRERPPGSIIAHDDVSFVRVDVRAWIDDGGAVHRADVVLHAPDRRGQHDVRVDFAPRRDAGVLVPVRLTESYRGEFTGEGVATYTNYRRFRTAGRLVPPPGR